MDLSANMINFAFQAYEQSNKTSLVCYKYTFILMLIDQYGDYIYRVLVCWGRGVGLGHKDLCVE